MIHRETKPEVDDAGQSPVAPTLSKRLPRPIAERYLFSIMRYAGVGVIGTLFHFIVLYSLLNYFNPVIASTTGAVVGCIVNFYLANSYVFAGRNSRLAFPKFVTVAIGGIAINAAVIAALTPYWPVFISQVFTTGTIFITGYVVNNAWSFSEHHA